MSPCRSLLPRAALLAAVLAGAPPARAAVAPDAARILDRHAAAIGERRMPATLHLTARLEAFGLAGRLEAWNAAPASRAAVISLGPFTLRDGCDGARAWRTDPTGKVVRLDGQDLVDARASAWFERERWLEPEAGGGRVTLAGAGRDSIAAYDVLEVAPPEGRPRRLWFDRATGLLARMVARHDDRVTTVRFSDWRPVAGRRLAFHSVQEVEGMAMNRMVLSVESAAAGIALPDTVFRPPGEAGASAVRYLGTPGVARLRFEYSAKHVWLRAAVNGGPPADFLYDTGASLTVLDSAWAARNGIATTGRLQGQGAGSAGSAALARLDRLRVTGAGADSADGVEIAGLGVAVLDLNTHLAPFFWREAAGIVGFDLIQRFVNVLDFDAETLTLHDPAAWRHEGGGASVPFTLAGHVPVVEFTLDGRLTGGFRIDVGSGSTVDLHRPFVVKHRLEERVPRTLAITGGGFGGSFTSRLGRMRSMSVGPYAWEDPLVILSGVTSGALASEDLAGNVGNGILDRFRVTLDYERRVMWLEPGRRFRERDGFSRSGVQLAAVGGRIVIGQVVEGSPGWKAGIRSGDVVEAVNGRPPRAFGPDAMARLMERSPAGTRVRFDLRRDGRPLRRTIRLAELI